MIKHLFAPARKQTTKLANDSSKFQLSESISLQEWLKGVWGGITLWQQSHLNVVNLPKNQSQSIHQRLFIKDIFLDFSPWLARSSTDWLESLLYEAYKVKKKNIQIATLSEDLFPTVFLLSQLWGDALWISLVSDVYDL